MRRLSAVFAVLLPLTAVADPCPSTSADLGRAYEEAIAAFDAMDAARFEAVRNDARLALTCLSGVIAPRDAAAYHRLEALDGFAAGSQERTIAAFRRAHEIDPDYELPTSIAPAGHPLRVAFDRASAAAPSPQDPLDLSGVDTWVDGRGTALRPRELPAVLQVRDQGEVTYTGYLMPGMGAPKSATRGGGKVVRTRERTGHGAGGGSFPTRRVVAGGGAGLALVGGVALLGSALQNKAAFHDEGTAYEDLRGLKGKANRQFFGFELLTVTAIGLGTVAVLPDSSMPAWVP